MISRKWSLPYDLPKKLWDLDQIKVYEAEKAARQSARRSLVAQRDIRAGETISDEMIGIKRPSGGIAADAIDQVIGKVAVCDIKKDTQFSFENLQ